MKSGLPPGNPLSYLYSLHPLVLNSSKALTPLRPTVHWSYNLWSHSICPTPLRKIPTLIESNPPPILYLNLRTDCGWRKNTQPTLRLRKYLCVPANPQEDSVIPSPSWSPRRKFHNLFSLWKGKWKSLSCVDSLRPHKLYSPWNSPGQNTGVGSYSFLQGVFPTQGLNPGLPHCRWSLYQLSYQGNPLFSGNDQILFLQISKFTLCWFCVNVTFLFQWKSRQWEEGFLTPYHLTYPPTRLHCLLSHICKLSLGESI